MYVPAKESFHHCIRIFPGITFPRTESLIAAVSTLNALMANAAGLLSDKAATVVVNTAYGGGGGHYSVQCRPGRGWSATETWNRYNKKMVIKLPALRGNRKTPSSLCHTHACSAAHVNTLRLQHNRIMMFRGKTKNAAATGTAGVPPYCTPLQPPIDDRATWVRRRCFRTTWCTKGAGRESALIADWHGVQQ